MPQLKELIAHVAGAQLVMPDGLEGDQANVLQKEFDAISTDTRTLSPGAIFFGLSGPRFEGAAFLQAAQDRGACAAVLSATASHRSGVRLPLILVPDALDALQQWARYWRGTWPGRCITVTGSNGKTTVKQMIQSIAQTDLGPSQVWATPGNLNNHIGVPLSVLGLRSAHQLAVFELGMNHPNEIAALAGIAQPHVALVNNAQREHQEFMKSVQAVAIENGAAFGALSPEGIAVYPRDPLHEAIWQRQIQHLKRPAIRFGLREMAAAPQSAASEVLGQWVSSDSGSPLLQIEFPDRQFIVVKPRGLGLHFALNMIAAAACAFAAGLHLQAIEQALNTFEPLAGRGRAIAISAGGTLVDDTYNANPDSVRAAIDALAHMGVPRALVLGDMGEVGDQGPQFHREVLDYAAQRQLDAIWLHGEAMALAHRQTGVGQFFDEVSALIDTVSRWVKAQQQAQHQPSLWIKGSRFMRMERVVQAIAQQQEGQIACC
ncbi:MAG: UDP-N-acetylmuramoyl-tripeptide--D-alanyl-D-alanine ligase [Betaproteobacteria bacterium]|nr:UDP-N-acetylmuramoyl-tripeptide--D-alanyl-D-alanine ligase [Betaproteobacteria bacterium]